MASPGGPRAGLGVLLFYPRCASRTLASIMRRPNGKRLKRVEPLLGKILRAVEPPRGKQWRSAPWSSIYDTLVGAAAALTGCRKTIELRAEGMSSYPRVRRELADLLRGFARSGEVQWSTPGFSLWSSGFFLDKAQINVVAAVDRMVNALVLRSLPVFKEEFQHIYIKSRVELLASVPAGRPVRRLCRDLVGAIDHYFDHANQASYDFLAMGAFDLRDPTLVEAGKVVTLDGAKSFGFVLDRVNSFKHRVDGAKGRVPETAPWIRSHHNTSLVEWVVTKRALVFAGEFFRKGLPRG